jgi:diguanylate cyclase (GGDEF)-like protein
MKILIAEDDLLARRMIERFLEQWGYSVISAADGTEAWEILQREDGPRLAILDWMMPGMDGTEIARALRQRRSEPYVYILILTSKERKQDVVDGLSAGADDYLTKPFDAEELRGRLHAGRRILALQEALISARDALRFQATHDPLTGLWNRNAAWEALEAELARAQRQGTATSAILADLDHFKQVTDQFGHLAGDAVLRETSRRLRTGVRIYDTVARYGGEEFLIVSPDCSEAAAVIQGERLRHRVGGEIVDLFQSRVEVKLSLGVAVAQPTQGTDASSLLRAADAALYRAKTKGRNRLEVAVAADIAARPGAEHGRPGYPQNRNAVKT